MSDKLKCKILLCGGLGNQLFQYAFGRALALRSEAILELDAVTLFEKDVTYRRSYALSDFQIPDAVRILRKSQPLTYFLDRVTESVDHQKPLARRSFVRENSTRRFYPEYISWVARRPVRLYGYWQCPQYFQEIEFQLRQDLQFRTPLCPNRLSLAHAIASENSVAVHVRRAQYERTLGIGYYHQAMKRIRSSVCNAKFYVFSDSPEWWTKHGDNGNDVTLVRGEKYPEIEDFKLMTHCKHFIIANSSFSWWAAWLSGSAKKQVFAPSSDIWDNPDILCKSWTPILVDRSGDPVLAGCVNGYESNYSPIQ